MERSNKKSFWLLLGTAIVLIAVIVFAVKMAGREEVAGTSQQNETSAAEMSWQTEIVADNLNIPWDIAFLPDGTMLVTERSGRILHVESGRAFPIEGVKHVGEGGLLGMTLHPKFEENNWVYIYQTTEMASGLRNRVSRYVYKNDALTLDRVILDNIPGARNHDGGRIEFGPDGFLYVAVGDASDEDLAQDKDSLAGSILRVGDDGSVPGDNPFGSAIYSYGHRNPQGLAWDDAGRLWSTEHGRSGIQSGFDEVNLIERGGNYGWPDSEGPTVLSGTIAPAAHSSASDTWAPASAAYRDGSIFFGGLRGEALYEAKLDGDRVSGIETHFKGEFGRIRTVRVSPDGYLYMTTSNRDGRGDVGEADDKIIRIR